MITSCQSTFLAPRCAIWSNISAARIEKTADCAVDASEFRRAYHVYTIVPAACIAAAHYQKKTDELIRCIGMALYKTIAWMSTLKPEKWQNSLPIVEITHGFTVINRNSQYLPQCKFDCVNCPHKDCVVPENWYKQIYGQKYYAEHPDYFQTYRETHKAERANYNKMWYRKNRDSKLARQREHRSNPSVKKERAVYDKNGGKNIPNLNEQS